MWTISVEIVLWRVTIGFFLLKMTKGSFVCKATTRIPLKKEFIKKKEFTKIPFVEDYIKNLCVENGGPSIGFLFPMEFNRVFLCGLTVGLLKEGSNNIFSKGVNTSLLL